MRLAFSLSVFTLVLFLGWFWLSSPHHPAVTTQMPAQKLIGSTGKALQDAPDLACLFEEFSNLLAFSSGMPGWRVSHISYKSGYYIVDVKPQSQLSSLLLLEKWLKRFELKFTLKKEGVQFFVVSQALKKQGASKLEDLNQIGLTVMEQLKKLLPTEAKIEVGNEGKKKGLVRNLEIKVKLLSTSPDVLILLGKVLLNYPVLIKELQLSMEDNLLSGLLEFIVLGK